jgi:alpha-tubulin suppressor-like RCC1 family protein
MSGRHVDAAAVLGALALAAAVAGCGGGGHAAPDGGDGSIDGDGDGDATIDGGETGGTTGIVVDTPSGMIATDSEDGHCDILEAVAAAASGRSVRECANPRGLARVVLAAGNTYPVPRTIRVSPGTEIGIADGASGKATISAAPGFAVGAGTGACLVSVANGQPDVWIRDVVLAQDPALTLTGACVTRGALNLRRVRVTGFGAGGVAATYLPTSGCDHVTDTQQATTLRVFNTLVDGNHSAGRGAGILSEGSGTVVLVSNSAIVNNAADGDGGGIYLGGGWATDIIQSSTISGNTSRGAGGGVVVRFAEATWTYLNLFNSTIAYNTAVGTGGGIQFEPAQVGVQDVSTYSSIVAANSSTTTMEWNINAGWSPTGIFNCVKTSLIYVLPGYPPPTDSGGCAFDVRNPFLGVLTPMGGEGDLPLHPLLVGSPAIDAALGDTTPDQQRDGWIKDFDTDVPADWMMFDPLVDGDGDGHAVRDLGAYERDDRWQAELLAVRAVGASATSVVTLPSGYDRGAGTLYTAASATNEFVTYALPIGEPGRYDLTIGVRRDADVGKFQVAIAESPGGPWTALGPEQDGYAATSSFAALGPFVTPLFASPGEKLVRVTVTGKNPASTSYRLYLDYIDAKKSAAPCAVADVAAGGNDTCALTSAGGVRCWGAGAGRDRPPAIDVVSGAAAVAVGGSHACALSSDGNVRCWGANDSGQLGDGTTTSRAKPPADPVLSGVKAIAAGRAYTCALMTGGGVRCWGANDSGQLGDGTTTDRLRPPSSDVLSGVAAITAGGAHACALMTGGGVRCWGANGQGQLGDGTTSDQHVPPPSDVVGDVAAVSAGDIHTCALTNAGGVRCWGHNLDAELGIGTYDTVLAPLSADVLSGAKQVVAANLFTCALLTTGGVRCWGLNSHGEIGDDTELQVDRRSPAATDVLAGAASLAAGLTHVCARMTSGGVRCWGGNDAGQLGDGLGPSFALSPPPMDLPGFTGTCP